MRTFRMLAVAVAGAASLASAGIAVGSGPAGAAASTLVTASVSSVEFNDQLIPFNGHVEGTPYIIRLTNVSTGGAAGPQQLGAATLMGANPSNFQIPASSDHCSNALLSGPGTPDSCTITVVPNPTAAATDYAATLSIPVTTDGTNTVTVGLTAHGVSDAPPVWTEASLNDVVVHWSHVPTVNGVAPSSYALFRNTTSSVTDPGWTQIGGVLAAAPGQYDDSTVVPDTNTSPPKEYYYLVEPVETGVNGGNPIITSPAVGAIPWEDGSAGTFHGVTTARILDTRSGLGGFKGRVTPSHPLHLKINGAPGMPAGNIASVVFNLTATNVTGGGVAVTVWPDGQNKPLASVLNVVPGQTLANLVTVPVGSDGFINLAASANSLDLIGDVNGYYKAQADHVADSGQYFGVDPFRAEDTRHTGSGPLPSHFVDEIPLFSGADAVHIKAAIVHITAVGSASAYGYFTAYDGVGAAPTGSSIVDWAKGGVASNLAIVPVAPCDPAVCGDGNDAVQIGVYNGSSQAAQVIVDVVGIIDDNTEFGGSTFKSMTPIRMVDTRTHTGLPGSIGPKTNATVNPGNLAGYYTMAMDTNVTAAHPTQTTWFTVWPSGLTGVTQPGTSDLNAPAGSIVPAHVVAQVGANNLFHIYNNAGSVGVIVDVDGTFELRKFAGGPGTQDNPTPQSVSGGLSLPAAKRTEDQPAFTPAHIVPKERPQG